MVLRGAGNTLLVDSGPDLRLQALRERLRSIDAVIYTHAHLDHVAGFDELRAFCWSRVEPLPLYANAACMNSLQLMYGWAFSAENDFPGYVRPAAHILNGPVHFGELLVTPLPVKHATVETNGFLFQAPGMLSTAYIPDVKEIPETTFSLLKNVDVLVVDALRPALHPTHFSVNEALAAADQCGAKAVWLTHLSHENDHATLQAKLPRNVSVAYDGLEISLAALA